MNHYMKLLILMIKCNRSDRDDLKKKQGILKTVFKGRPLPDLSLVQKTKCRTISGWKKRKT